MKNFIFKKTINYQNLLTKIRYTYNFKWLGLRTIQLPTDLIVLQELIYRQKPDVIIETGVAHGGSLIFYSSLLELLNKKFKRVIGIDILIRSKNRKKILNHPLSKNIELIQLSSTSDEILKKLKKIRNKKIMVVLDSNHAESHVLKELEIYSELIKKGGYIVVLDTAIEFIDNKLNSKSKPFSRGNNPYTAVKKFLKRTKKFIIDREFEEKAIISNAYSGFLKRIK